MDIVTVRDRARFVGPSSRSAVVPRSRLDHLFEQAVGRVVRVAAPGGYGKSTLAARWVAGDRRVVAWVDIEPIDNDPEVLTHTLARALSGVADLDPEALPTGPPGGADFVETVVPRFGALIRSCETPFVLVLDDVHHLEAPASCALVDAVAAGLPPESTLVLSGRSRALEDSIARLRLDPGVVDVAVEDLALDRAETRDLLRSLGLDLSEDDLDVLCSRFEGWPAGLRLAGLGLLAGRDLGSTAVDQAGQVTFVTDYLRSEWTARLARDDAAFLREAACLGRFNGELCDAVLDRPGSAARLRRLHRTGQVVLPLDCRDDWFRLHPLLADWLAADLADGDRERWRRIHLGSSRWWEARGDIDLAFVHATAVDDLERAEHLVECYAGAYFTRGLHRTVRSWLSSFPRDTVSNSAPLLAVGCVGAIQIGDAPRMMEWLRRLTRVVERQGGEGPVDERSALRLATLRAAVEPRPAGELMVHAERACRDLPGGPWRSLACLALGGLQFLTGDDRAAESFADGASDGRSFGLPGMEAHNLAGESLLADLRGDRRTAADAARAARLLVQGTRLELLPQMVLVGAVSALDEARAGHGATAAEELVVSRRALARFATVTPWFNVMALLALGRAALQLDDVATAGAVLGELEHQLRYEPADNGARPYVDELRAAIEGVANGPDHGRWALTTAESRVLQHLPTNLSLGEIAERLFVSRNTVKSHAAAIYRKLGATSRGQAVDAARAGGLLAGHDDVLA